jgi:murein DD-endopeptidase MepM/ murein hydrolase activator NlpD
VRRRLPALLAAAAAASFAASPATGAGTLATRRAEVRRLEARLARLDLEAGTAAAATNAALDRLDEARAALTRNARDIRQTRRDLGLTRTLMARRLVLLYKGGQPTMAEILLGGRSLTRATATADVLDRVSRFDARMVASMKDRRARLVALRAQAARNRADAADAAGRAEEHRRSVAAVVARQRAAVAGARADLRRALAAERARLARLAAAKAEAEAGTPYRAGAAAVALPPDVSHVFPVAGPSHFTDDWLQSRAGGRVHEGIDLFAAMGTPVVAVADGTVFRVGWNGLGGWRLWLRDRAGTTFYYAHLSSYASAAREGASVAGGTVLGFVGMTGDAQGTSPHLHFEIHPGGGGPTRPYPIVTSWPRA